MADKSTGLDHHPDQLTIFDLLYALSGLDDYVGRRVPGTKDLEICRLDDLPENAKVIGTTKTRKPEGEAQQG